jgi:protein-tyrosine phosphatase
MSQDQLGFRWDYPLTQVLDRLYLGGFKDAEDLRTANPLGISHVCNCTTEKLNLNKRRFHIIQMDQIDGHEWNVPKLYAAVNWVREALMTGGRVLIHCHAGVSRSPVLTACYLYTCGFDFNRALNSLVALRPAVDPAAAVLLSAKKAYGIK